METSTQPVSTPEDSQQLSSSEQGQSWLPWLLLVLGVLLGGGSFAVWQQLSANQTPAPAIAQTAPPARPVETVTSSQGNGMRRIQLLGQVEASERATIRTRTAGLVQRITVQAGDRVRAGMEIAVLDDTDQKLAVAQAQANLAQQRSQLAELEAGTRPEIIAQRQGDVRSAQAREQGAIDNLQRTTQLVKEGALAERVLVEARTAVDNARGERLRAQAALAEAQEGPRREVIEAQQANVAAAQAELNQARLALQRTKVTAPSAGIVQTKQVSVGDLVESNAEVVTLVDGTQLDVLLELPEELGGRVSAGMPIQLKTRALSNWQGRATITGVLPAANSASRRQMVRVRLENPPTGLLPGMAVEGQLEVRANSPSFVVPRDALIRRGNQWLVFTVADNKAQRHEVQMIADMGQEVAIYGDQLRVGQPVVVSGGDGLADQAAVKATPRK